MTRAISDEACDRLFEPLLGVFPSLLLAVSGGADSMSMMVLAARWRSRLPRARQPQLLVATFDHRLRAEAAEEARWVGVHALQLGLDHRILVWPARKRSAGVQAEAREARYGALSALAMQWAGGDTPVAILTAHHIEDQAETFIMRLARGSGVDGLAGMAAVRWLVPDQLAIARPLLGTCKSELVATLTAAGIGWKEDPSNGDAAFERVRVRKAAGQLGELGLTAKALGDAAGRIGRVREVIERAVEAAERRVLAINGGAYAAILRVGFARLPEELRVRILGRVLFAFGGQATPPRLSQVEGLAQRLRTAKPGFTVTLGGCLLTMGRRQLIVHREMRRTGMPVALLEPGKMAEWDRRFRVHAAHGCKQAVHVAALGEADARALTDSVGGLPLAAARTLPEGWQPHVDGAQAGKAGPAVAVTFTYPRILWDAAGD